MSGNRYENFSENISRLIPPESRRMVRVDPDSWSLIEMRSTGRLRQAKMSAGSASYTADIPERAPYRIGTAEDLTELAEQYGYREKQEDRPLQEWEKERISQEEDMKIRDAKISQAIESILTERILEAANAAKPLTTKMRSMCSNCSGRGGGATSCLCKDNGDHYLGVLADSDDLIVDEPSGDRSENTQKGYDPACPDCHGTGESRWTCQPCQGTGETPYCLDWEITGPAGKLTLRHDVAALLRNGDAKLNVRVSGRHRILDVTVSLDCSTLQERINNTVAEGQPTWVRKGTFFHGWDLSAGTSFSLDFKQEGTRSSARRTGGYLSSAQAPFAYSLRTYSKKTRKYKHSRWVSITDIESILPSGKALLKALQESVAGGMWSPPENPEENGYRVGKDGLVESIPYMAVVRVPGEVLLDEAIAMAHEAGFALALTYSFVATGQTGPSLYLMDDQDRPLIQLDVDYYWESALASAYVRLPEALAKATEAGYGPSS